MPRRRTMPPSFRIGRPHIRPAVVRALYAPHAPHKELQP